MTKKRFLKCIAQCAIAGLCASTGLASTPTVTDIVAKQRYPWNGLVDITCKVTGIVGETNGLYFAVQSVNLDSCNTNHALHVRVVMDGTNSTDWSVHTNGNYRLVWDAKADLGEGIYSNVVVCVDLKATGKVQLWEGGPYWAETNIGAEAPEEYGYYFWWGDTIGYKRENDAWVASDWSSSNFSFTKENAPSYRKDDGTLQSEGWVVSQDGTYVLAPEHDAAQVQWGGEWRIPTIGELYALTNNCDWTWTTVKGVNGYIVRGKGNYASASIFLPCAGNGDGTSLDKPGSDGYYWSSVPYTYYTSRSYYTRALYFDAGSHGTGYYYRYWGRSVRPVQGFTE